MAKFEFFDKIKEKFGSKILNLGAEAVDLVDEVCVEVEEIADAGILRTFYVGAYIIDFYDKIAALVIWFVLKTLVHLGRYIHEIKVKLSRNKKIIFKDALIVGAGCIVIVAIFAAFTGYEYYYNGRPLGIVKEQKDVLEILELASDELSKEYGSTIVIDPKTDISFRPVLTYGKEIDTEDQVLKRFAYMGEINAIGSAIFVDGQIIAIVESETVANEVLQDIKNLYISTSDEIKYEYVGFVQEVTIEEYSTKLTNILSRVAAVEKIKGGAVSATRYQVVAGDSIESICEKFDLTTSEFETLNPGITSETNIYEGDIVNLTSAVPALTVETIEVATYAETIPYETEYQDSSYYYVGDTVVSRNGSDGKERITARLTKHNGTLQSSEILDTEVLVQPVSEVILKGTKKVPAKTGTGTFIRPVNVSIYSGYGWRWGRMHSGVDFSASTGTPIKAADGGTVTLAGWYYGYGYAVIIDHGSNTKTLYGHCSALYVSAGQKVYQGQTIAAVGNTGNSTGPHCHFEIIINGTNVNPEKYF
jgi:murein DD-endopeptidase MepM/ murein hydrolase activator NlpD